MARPLRIEYDGAWYHVMNRGVARNAVFTTDSDRRRFLDALKDVSEIYSIEIHAYSLMGNHYHLLVRTPLSGLGRAMQHLNGVYAQAFNQVHHRDGPLFRGRYKAVLIDANEHISTIARYIHRNPINAGLAHKAEDHPWSSHRYYLRHQQSPEWLHRDVIMSQFGHGQKAINAFHDYVHQPESDTKTKLMLANRHGILGSGDFRKWVVDNFVSENRNQDRGIPQKMKRAKNHPSAKTLIHRVAFAFNVPAASLRVNRRRIRNDAKTVAAFLLRRTLGLSLNEIGRHLNMGYDAVAQSIHRNRVRMARDRALSDVIEQIHLDFRHGDAVSDTEHLAGKM